MFQLEGIREESWAQLWIYGTYPHVFVKVSTNKQKNFQERKLSRISANASLAILTSQFL
jgi:hypothetical protein